MDTAVPGLPKRYFSRTSRMVRLMAYRIGRIRSGISSEGRTKRIIAYSGVVSATMSFFGRIQAR